MKPLPLLLIIAVTGFLYTCSPSGLPEKDQVEALHSEVNALHCRLQALHRESVALWDSVGAILSESLPAGMPAAERNNMIAVRNAGLIQMFEVYPQLDPAVQQLVEAAGRRDAALAARMRAAKDSLDSREREVQALLAQWQGKDPEQLSAWQARLGTLDCPYPSSSK